jgi:hypothetical protein
LSLDFHRSVAEPEHATSLIERQRYAFVGVGRSARNEAGNL